MNIVLQSRMKTGDDKIKQRKESDWVHKAPEKEIVFYMECAKDTFMEAKNSFIEDSTLGSQDTLYEEVDPSMLTTFLETCMKLLHDRKVVKGLHELINKYVGKEVSLEGNHIFR